MKKKVSTFYARNKDLEQLLADPKNLEDRSLYAKLMQEYSYTSEVCQKWKEIEEKQKDLKELSQIIKEERDEEFIQTLQEEVTTLTRELSLLETELENMLIPPSPQDHANAIIEIRAGTGGDEAALFVGDCVRMYKLYADKKRWKYELLSCAEAEVGGYREYIMVLSGKNVYRLMQYEGGTHRVQRIPKTETQGRIHTSAITIAVLREPEEKEITIRRDDLRIDSYRASGAGGQHVNTTDSAVRITHMPTGIAVYCQEERSQHKNKEEAMRLLEAKIAEMEKEKQNKDVASIRSAQVGSGDRSERIRTYNFPQNRVTDHRISLTLHHLDRFLEGEMEEMTQSLCHFYKQKALS